MLLAVWQCLASTWECLGRPVSRRPPCCPRPPPPGSRSDPPPPPAQGIELTVIATVLYLVEVGGVVPHHIGGQGQEFGPGHLLAPLLGCHQGQQLQQEDTHLADRDSGDRGGQEEIAPLCGESPYLLLDVEDLLTCSSMWRISLPVSVSAASMATLWLRSSLTLW